MRFTQEQIEKRAYEIYLARGREEGKALDYWLAAKLDLLLESLETPENRLHRLERTMKFALESEHRGIRRIDSQA